MIPLNNWFLCASIVIFLISASVTQSSDTAPAASGFRPIDGYGNNLIYQTRGSYRSTYERLDVTDNGYADGLSSVGGIGRTDARVISNKVLGAEPSQVNTSPISDILPYWGQFIAHDIALTMTNANETIPISIEICDLVERRIDCQPGQTMTFNFSRALAADYSGNQVRRVMNFQTSYIDASTVYGANANTAALLRTFSGGLLKSYIHPVTGKELLPLANNITTFSSMSAGPFVTNTTQLFLAGDMRANVHPALQSLHTLFMREHNRRARELLQANPSWTDEHLYQRARAWVIALVQKITFTQYLPTLLGAAMPQYTGYDPTINTDLEILFVGAAFRYGHSAVSPLILRLLSDGQPARQGHLLLRDHFFNTEAILDEDGDIESILRGLTRQVDQMVDSLYTDELRNHFADQPYDLGTINIVRGRDFGLPSYGTVLTDLGLTVPNTFQDVTQDDVVAARLASVYNSVEEMDVYIAGLAEAHVSPSHMGPLFTQLVQTQFLRLRNGDRFWYERDNVLTADELQLLASSTLGTVIKSNTDIAQYPDNPFAVYSGSFEADTNTSTSTSCSTGTSTTQLFQFTSDMRLEVTVTDPNDSNPTLDFLLCSNTTGWIGIGFNAIQQTMNGADLIIATKTSPTGPWNVQDYYSGNDHNPVLDSQSNLILDDNGDAASSCFSTQGVHFKRLANTGDTAQDTAIIKDTSVNLLYAFGSGTFVASYHGGLSRGAISATLFSSSGSSSTDSNNQSDSSLSTSLIYRLKAFHGFCMFVSYAILYPTAVFIIRYTSIFYPNAVTKHRTIMSTATLIGEVASAAVFFVTHVPSTFSQPHPVIGVILFTLTLVNAFLGLSGLEQWNWAIPYQLRIRLVHRWLGRTIVVLGLISCGLGIDLITAGTPLAGKLIAFYYVWLVILAVTFIVLGEFNVLNRFALHLFKQHARRRSSSLNHSTSVLHINNKAAIAFSWKEIKDRIEAGADWLIISGNIYEVGEFVSRHPGGSRLLLDAIGTDATRSFYGTISELQEKEYIVQDGLVLAHLMTASGDKSSQAPTSPKVLKSAPVTDGKNEAANAPVKTMSVRLPSKQKNLHSKVAMLRLKQLFVGGVLDYDPTDNDDLMTLVKKSFGQGTAEGTSEKPRPMAVLRSSSVKQSQEYQQTQYRQDILQRLMPQLIEAKLIPGITSHYYRNLRLISKTPVVHEKATHAVYRFRFALERPSHTVTFLPGDAVTFFIRSNEPKFPCILRQYTPIMIYQRGILDFIIKVYPNGPMTSHLNKLDIGDTVRVAGPQLHRVQLNPKSNFGCWKKVVLLAAGSGLTPMLLLLDHYRNIIRMNKQTENLPEGIPEKVQLISTYHTINDAILKEEIEKVVAQNESWLSSILSVTVQPPPEYANKVQHVGRLNAASLKRFINISIRADNASTEQDAPQVNNIFDDSIKLQATLGLPSETAVRSRRLSIRRSAASADMQQQDLLENKHDYHIFVCGPGPFNEDMCNILVNELSFDYTDITLL